MYIINDNDDDKYSQSDEELEFKTGEENKPKKKFNFNINMNTVIPIVGAIFLGIIVYFIASLIFSGNKTNPVEKTMAQEVDIKNKVVQKLYGYVTYGDYDIFEKIPSVKLENLSNYDKFYYISSLINDNDIEELQTTTSDEKVLSINQSKIKKYMEEFFGNKVKFNKDVSLPLTLKFTHDNKNSINLKYNPSMSAYYITFVGNNNFNNSNYYSELVSAKTYDNGNLELTENIVYYDYKLANNKISYNIYKDYNHTMLIESKKDVDKDSFKLKDVITSNKSKITKVKFTFKKGKKNYYFYSSKIVTK